MNNGDTIFGSMGTAIGLITTTLNMGEVAQLIGVIATAISACIALVSLVCRVVNTVKSYRAGKLSDEEFKNKMSGLSSETLKGGKK